MEELAASSSASGVPPVADASPQDRALDSDGSSCSEWQPGSSDDLGSEEEELALTDLEESSEEATVNTSINLNGDELQDKITSLLQADPCEGKCLQGKEEALKSFLCSLSQMTSRERKQSIITALAVLKETDTVLRHRGYGLREQFHYYLPLVGRGVARLGALATECLRQL
ncbi:unnamed protein product [Phytophthora fragariaefolia]|uniref:Unnamed protein product n=1 Tax=Phytophthora fragariaefolia TaxID=1490495 RepID=A0A9W6YMQ7_9STRA|nr:unnamed protein product [Phytophthora fragariaefolia]